MILVMCKFRKKHLEEIFKGIKLYNQGKYWECHEDLEEYWLERAHDPVRYIYWVIIQVAVSIYHLEGNNVD